MTVMQIREIRLCPAHRTAIVRLDDSERRLTMTFAADPHEASRLARVMEHGPRACHPMLDFVGALLGSFEAGVVRVVLDDVQGEGSPGSSTWAGAAPNCRCRATPPTPSRWRSGPACPSTRPPPRSLTPNPPPRHHLARSPPGSTKSAPTISTRPKAVPDPGPLIPAP